MREGTKSHLRILEGQSAANDELIQHYLLVLNPYTLSLSILLFAYVKHVDIHVSLKSYF